ncbi:MAG: hypothetical protein BAJALOKI3v1_370015 [Promethearchaeota archaeon]|nr:MAG: hypothetical protein BAJALOKI3v1_370015 [Candidatus Lokiarchaeota archaeon]
MDKNKISIVRIKEERISKAVNKALELINAENLFIKENMTILIKPNILKGEEPERAVTTHPEIIRAVIRWIKKHGKHKIVVGESSGTTNPGATEKAFQGSGIKDVCEEENVEWTPFEQTKRKIYQIKDPLVLDQISSSVLLEEADLIINIPKIKTHWQCVLTCCIKNMFGTLILGNKPKTHARFPKLEDFSAALADIHSVSNPQLTVVDGYLCQEGSGPSKGDVVKLDLILAGYDPVALDTTVCKIIQFDPEDVIQIQKAEERGLGTSDLETFEIVGEKIDDVTRKFKMAKQRPVSVPLPDWLADYMSNVIFRARVKFDPNKCKLCATCWENCPANAISPADEIKKGNVPNWVKNECIFCYCCAELCPHEAVDFEINYVRNFLYSKVGVIFLIMLAGIIGLLLWFILSLIL